MEDSLTICLEMRANPLCLGFVNTDVPQKAWRVVDPIPKYQFLPAFSRSFNSSNSEHIVPNS